MSRLGPAMHVWSDSTAQPALAAGGADRQAAVHTQLDDGVRYHLRCLRAILQLQLARRSGALQRLKVWLTRWLLLAAAVRQSAGWPRWQAWRRLVLVLQGDTWVRHNQRDSSSGRQEGRTAVRR